MSNFQRDYNNWENPIVPSIFGMATFSSVTGNVDRRIKVENPKSFPWNAVCSLMIEGENGKRQSGTGWLAGPRTVITAGHCVYSRHSLGGWATAIYAVPGRNGGFPHHHSSLSATFKTLEGWHGSTEVDFDIGCITLDKPLVGVEECLEMVDTIPPNLEGSLVTISGYPSDRSGGIYQYMHRGNITKSTSSRAYYDIDTAIGQSGAPLLIADTATRCWQVLGVHTNGFDSHAPDSNVNCGPLLSQSIREKLREWITQDSVSLPEALD
ncbi:MAG TPA: trypsin-like serine protease [Burkholderiaceae bacterium]|nr:trypsin-like serine protease [Burkholderiaceae bacterium]